MSGFRGINQFGSLTVNGQKLTFEDFDKDKNGEITQEEYTNLLKEVKLDSVELSTIDKDGDKAVSEDEFAVWEQKTQMQDAVNEMKSQISRDFSGKTQYLTEVTNALKDFIDGFALTYTGDVSGMADAFKAALPEKYQDIKKEALKNDPSTVKSNVIDELLNNLSNEKTLVQSLGKKLETAANTFVKNYKGDNLAEDLKTYLEEYMNKSDSEKLQDDVAAYRQTADSFGAYIDSDELVQLKEAAKDFLKTALEKNVTVKLGGTTVKTEAAITSALKKFTDAQALNDAMEEVFAALSTTNLVETTKADEKANADAAAVKAFTDIKGDSYKIDPNTIDYSTGFDPYNKGKEYYFSNKMVVLCRQATKSSSLNDMKKEISTMLATSLKEQFKAQITKMLKEKGFSFDKIETVFENVFKSSCEEAINNYAKIRELHMPLTPTYCSVSYKTKDLVDGFISIFNTNISSAIDSMNSSDKDMDLQDIDYSRSAIGLHAARATKVSKKESSAPRVIERFRPQLEAKAQKMCNANNVEYNSEEFSAIFNNSKLETVSNIKMSEDKMTVLANFMNLFKEKYTALINSKISV